ncbi:MAG TPA: hypothetical protein VF123_08425 [Candidatus Sulfotelmatobacter sp.]
MGEQSAIRTVMVMLRNWGRRFLLLLVVGATLVPARLLAQNDPNDVPLGDVARNLRKKAPTKPVIDDDNLSQVMQEADSRKGFGSSLRFLMDGDLSGFRVSAPDVTCNLSFSSNVKSLLAGQYSEMDMPGSELARLEGHASMEGDALTVSVHNGTDWHVSEIAVAVMIVRKSVANAAAGEEVSDLETATEVQTDKKPDTTVIYRMRAVGVPWSVTTFSARLQSELGAGSEWHWAVVQGRGYPPESYRRRNSSQADAENDAPAPFDNREAQDPAAEKMPAISPVSNSGNPQLIRSNPQ